MTSEVLPNVTFLPVEDYGQSQLDLLDGPTTDLFGPQAARVSRSRKPVKVPELMTNGICGQTWIDSSAKPMLQGSDLVSLWGSRLAARLGQIGSTESPLIWRGKVTKSGRVTYRLAPWTPPTSGKDNTGSRSQAVWRTPNSRENGGGSYSDVDKAIARHQAGRQINLEDQMVIEHHKASPWVTPSSRDWKDSPGMATERPDGRSRIDQLPRQMTDTMAACRSIR